MSRLLRQDEDIWIRTRDELRDDTDPLSQADLELLHSKYPSDINFLVNSINKFRSDSNIPKIHYSHQSFLPTQEHTPTTLNISSIHSLVSLPIALYVNDFSPQVSYQPFLKLYTTPTTELNLLAQFQMGMHDKDPYRVSQADFERFSDLCIYIPPDPPLFMSSFSNTTPNSKISNKTDQPPTYTVNSIRKRVRFLKLMPEQAQPNRQSSKTQPSKTGPQNTIPRSASTIFLNSQKVQNLATPEEITELERRNDHQLEKFIQHAMTTTDLASKPEPDVLPRRKSVRIAESNLRISLETLLKKDDNLLEKNNTLALIKNKKRIDKLQPKISKAESDKELHEHRLIEKLNEKIEDFDHLVRQLYVDPISHTLFEIINTFYDKNIKAFMTTSRSLDADGYMVTSPEIQIKEINQPLTGTKHLVTEFLNSNILNSTHNPWPQTHEDWITAQSQDETYGPLIKQITNPNITFPVPYAKHKNEIYCRPALISNPSTIGPLMIAFERSSTITFKNEIITTTSTILRTVIPTSLIQNCHELHHEGFGHPGRNRTLKTINLRFHIQNLYKLVHTHCGSCKYCIRKKAHKIQAKVPIMNVSSFLSLSL